MRTFLFSLLLLFSFSAHFVDADAFDAEMPHGTSLPHSVDWLCGTPELMPDEPPILPVPHLPEIPAAPAPEVHLGDIARFYTHIPEQLVKGTCIAIGEHIYIYIENSVKNVISEAEAQEIAAEFDSRIYPQVQRWMRTEWKPGLDRDGRVTLLMHDVGANGSSQNFGGYFSPTDERPTDLNSNRREMVFMDVFLFRERPRFTFYSSLAHEFAHLISWYQHGGTSEQRWLEEGMASFAEWAVYGNVHTIFVEGYLKDASISLTSGNTADVYYGATFTLLLYLFENYGGVELIRELVHQKALGTMGIDAALVASGKAERFADVLQNWAMANFINDTRQGALLGYQNLPERFKVSAAVQQVSSYPTRRSDSLNDWGVRYVTFQNLPRQLEVALEGSGEGALYAQVAHLPNLGAASLLPIRFDENNNGHVVLNNLTPADQVILMVTTTVAQSFRYAATADESSGIVVGPPRPIGSSVAVPDAITRAIGSRSQPSQKRSNISYKLEPMSQVHLSSSYQDVVIAEKFAYAVSDWGLEIFDLTMPSMPLRVGEIATPGNAQGLAIDGEIAYIADGTAGVQLIDIRQLESPRLIKTVGNFKHASRIQIANGYAYVVDTKSGLLIFKLDELRDSPNPQPISTFKTSGDALAIRVDGDTVYLSDERDGFQILDFGRINTPAIAGKVEILGFDFQVVNGYAYVTSGNLQIVDVRNRFKPEVVATVRTPGFAGGVKFRDGYAYLTDAESGLHIVDARNPRQPQIVGLQPVTGSARGLDVFIPRGQGEAEGTTLAYVAAEGGGLQVIDVSQPERPRWLNRYDASGEAYGLDIVDNGRGGKTAYIADGRGGLKIVEIERPYDATLTHHIPIDGIAADVRVDNGYATIAAGEGGLIIMDVRDANRPKQIARLNTPEPAWGVEIDGGYAYVSAGELIVVDIRNPLLPRVLAQRRMAGSAYRVALAPPPLPAGGRPPVDGGGQWAYVAALDGGIQVFDVTDPANPRAIGSYETKGVATNVAIVGERAYVLDSRLGVQILNIADAQRPIPIAKYETDVLPIDVKIGGDYLYLLDQQSVQIVDIRNLGAPRLISHFDQLHFPSGLAVIGEAVYVADLYDLRMFKINADLFELSVNDPTLYGDPLPPPPASRGGYTNRLEQNYPNPFNPETWIPYEIAMDASVTIQIYDIHGALVHRLDVGQRRAGRYATREHAAYWNGRNESGELVSNGIYFYELQVETPVHSATEFKAVRKMLLKR